MPARDHSDDLVRSAQRIQHAEQNARIRAETYQTQDDRAQAISYAEGLRRANEIIREVYDGQEEV